MYAMESVPDSAIRAHPRAVQPDPHASGTEGPAVWLCITKRQTIKRGKAFKRIGTFDASIYLHGIYGISILRMD